MPLLIQTLLKFVSNNQKLRSVILVFLLLSLVIFLPAKILYQSLAPASPVFALRNISGFFWSGDAILLIQPQKESSSTSTLPIFTSWHYCPWRARSPFGFCVQLSMGSPSQKSFVTLPFSLLSLLHPQTFELRNAKILLQGKHINALKEWINPPLPVSFSFLSGFIDLSIIQASFQDLTPTLLLGTGVIHSLKTSLSPFAFRGNITLSGQQKTKSPPSIKFSLTPSQQAKIDLSLSFYPKRKLRVNFKEEIKNFALKNNPLLSPFLGIPIRFDWSY